MFHKLKLRTCLATQELEDACQWLDEWDRYNQTLNSDQRKKFLTQLTCHGLRVTLHSTIELAQLLLDDGYSYVLTAKFNQDPLEVPLCLYIIKLLMAFQFSYKRGTKKYTSNSDYRPVYLALLSHNTFTHKGQTLRQCRSNTRPLNCAAVQRVAKDLAKRIQIRLKIIPKT